MKKNIALINYTGSYFQSFANALKDVDFNVSWVCLTTSDANYLKNKVGVDSSKVLDITQGFHVENESAVISRQELSKLEMPGLPTINDIILMDRVLKKRTNTAYQFLNHVQKKLTKFFTANEITLVTSGRDSSVQLMSMMVAKNMSIPWVVPTRLRIPLETYGFCSTHETAPMLNLKEDSDKATQWADKVLSEFESSRHRPALKIAARRPADVLKLIKPHTIQFSSLLWRAREDKGNIWTRYTVLQLVKMYLSRRVNMIRFNQMKLWQEPTESPFCIYALHTQPESSIDVAGSFYSDQIGLVRLIARSLPSTHELYVKVHPTDVDGQKVSYYEQLVAIPGVRLIHDSIDSRTLIAKADVIFTLTGTMGHEAGLLGKPVITFANNYYNSLPTVFRSDNPTKLGELIEKVLSMRPSMDLRSQIRDEVAKFYTNVFFGEVNRLFGENPTSLKASDLKTLSKAYTTLYNHFQSKDQVVFSESDANFVEMAS